MVRGAIAFAVAYLLVLQAAFAGGAMQRMDARGGLATQILCLNGATSAPAEGKVRPAPFDCCGLGCLVGTQTLQSPTSPDEALVYPAARRFEQGSAFQAAADATLQEHGPSPRGPPAVG